MLAIKWQLDCMSQLVFTLSFFSMWGFLNPTNKIYTNFLSKCKVLFVVSSRPTDWPPFHEEDPSWCGGFQRLGRRTGLSWPPCSGFRPLVSCCAAQRPDRSSHHHQVTLINLMCLKTLEISDPQHPLHASPENNPIFTQNLLFFLFHRFLFILLGPLGKGPQYHEIGRSIATLMTDEVRP